MVTAEYRIAYSEVLEILKHLKKDDLNKIPTDMINMFKKNASNDVNFSYNPKKSLKEQKVSETAQIIISILARDYWITKEQKQKILYYQKKSNKKNIQ